MNSLLQSNIQKTGDHKLFKKSTFVFGHKIVDESKRPWFEVRNVFYRHEVVYTYKRITLMFKIRLCFTLVLRFSHVTNFVIALLLFVKIVKIIKNVT